MDDDKFYVPNRLEIKPAISSQNARTQKRYWPLNAIRIAAQTPIRTQTSLYRVITAKGGTDSRRPILSLVKPARGTIGESQGHEQPLGIFQSAPAQSPSPGLAEKYLSNFPVSSQ